MNDKQRDTVDRLVDAYEAMLERVHDAADNAEKKTVPWMREALADARDKAVEFEELTREEADKVSRYVERDLHDAATFIAETGQEFRDWVSFDWQLMQNHMLEMFAGMADQTGAALKGFAEQARQASRYRNLAGHIRRQEALLFHLEAQQAQRALDEARAALSEMEGKVAETTQEAAQSSTAQPVR